MQCNDFEQRMQRLLDLRRRPELDAELTAHACVCGQCSEMLETQALLLDGLEHAILPATERPRGVEVVRLCREPLQAKTTHARRPGVRWLLPSLLVAALCLLAVMPISQYLGRGRNARQAGAAVAFADALPRAIATPSDVALAEYRSAGHQMTAGLLALQDLNFGLPDSERIASGLRPLAYTFSFAYDAFRNVFVVPFEQYDATRDAPDVISLIL